MPKMPCSIRASRLKKPDSEGDFKVDEVGEPEHGKTEGNGLRGGIAEEGDTGLQIDTGNKVIVIAQRIEAADDKRYRESQSHQPILEKGLRLEVFSPSSSIASGTWTRGKVRRSRSIHCRRRMTMIKIMEK